MIDYREYSKNVLLSELRASKDVQKTYNMLLAVSAGKKGWFSCSDRELAHQTYTEYEIQQQDVIFQEHNIKQVYKVNCYRKRKRVLKFQEELGVSFLEIIPGDRRKGKGKECTKYKITLLSTVDEIISSAKKAKGFKKNQKAKIMEYTVKFANEIKEKALQEGTLKVKKKTPKPEKNDNDKDDSNDNHRGDTAEPLINILEQEKEIGEVISADAVSQFRALDSSGLDTFSLCLYDEHRSHFYKDSLHLSEVLSLLPKVLGISQNSSLCLSFRASSSSEKVHLFQLDDISPSVVELVRPYSLFTIETSPGNFQAAIAVQGLEKDDVNRFYRKLKSFFKADPGANGSFKVVGSLNAKKRYLNCRTGAPTVLLHHHFNHRIVDRHDLDELGFSFDLFPKTRKVLKTSNKYVPCRKTEKAPDGYFGNVYRKHLGRVRKKIDGITPDYSLVDFIFSCETLRAGYSFETVVEELRTLRDKAKKRVDYAIYTVRSAQKRILGES